MQNELYQKRRDQIFPKLAEAQLARLYAHGQRIRTQTGQLLTEPGQSHQNLLVVLEGSLEVALPGMHGEEIITVLSAGDFSGEMSTLRGIPGFTRIRVRDPGEVLKINDEELREVVQTDAEISELFMRAFILRRMGLVESREGDAMVLGSRHSAGTLRIREFLTRNNYPHVNIDVDEDAGVQEVLDRFHVKVDEIPVLIGRCGKVFRNPSIQQVAEFLQMNPVMDDSKVHDLVVVGAGPAGLAAAVCAASDGLDVLVVEANAPGGQAGTSSRIENYLGFPTGISGQDLAGLALVQSQKFGAKVSVACHATRLRCDKRPYALELSDGRTVQSSTVIIATGAKYREPDIANLKKFIGAGIYYAATFLESKLCLGEEIAVVGGGNSAGQAAVYLASTCSKVHLVVRSDGLAETMSRYLIRRIEENPRITLHVRTQISALDGEERLQRVTLHNEASGKTEVREIANVFLMTGAVPNTDWLNGCLALDDKAFVRTGSQLKAEDLRAAGWQLQRSPHLMETTLPGVFAVGDVRSDNVKRIASAVGEGSICVQFVHKVLQEFSVPSRHLAAA